MTLAFDFDSRSTIKCAVCSLQNLFDYTIFFIVVWARWKNTEN